MKLDPHGNLIVMGSTASTLTVGRKTFSGGAAAVFSLDPDANVLWSRSLPGGWWPVAFALDGAGNIYLVGGKSVSASGDLGTGPISGPAILAKLDAQGNPVWSRGLQDFLDPSVTELGEAALDVDPTTGEVAVAGIVYSSSGGYRPAFLAFYDASGAYLASLAPNSATSPMKIDVAFDGAGNLTVAGTTQPTPTAAVTPLPIQSAYVEKLDTTHAVRWNLALGDDTTVNGLAAAGTRTYVGGTFGGSLSLGGTSVSSQGLEDLFIATIDDDGTTPTTSLVARYPGANSSLTGLITDGQGGVWASSTIRNFVDFGTGMIAPLAYVVWHADGTGQSVASGAFPVGPYGEWYRQPLATDAAGNLYFFGTFMEGIDLGTGPLVDPTNNQYLFLAKYAPTRPTVQSRSCPPPTDALLAGGPSKPALMALAGEAMAFSTGTETLSVPLAGGAPSVLAAAQKHTVGLAVAGSTVYWANAGSMAWEGPAGNGSIVSAPLAGGTPTVLADKQNQPVAIAVDDTNIYWTTTGAQAGAAATSTTGAGVWALPLGGGGTPKSLAGGLGAVGPIAAAAGVVVFAAGTKIIKVSAAGGDAVAIATTDRRVTAIALDGASVYWTDADSLMDDHSHDDGRVRQATLDGASSSILVSNQAEPVSLSLVGGTLTWCTAGGYRTSGIEYLAGLWSLPTSGGTPSAIVSGLVAAGPCTADGAHAAWVASDGSGNWKLIVQAR